MSYVFELTLYFKFEMFTSGGRLVNRLVVDVHNFLYFIL